MSEEIIPIKCPACKSENYLLGFINTNHVFVPEGKKTAWSGFATEAYACLNCGHVFHYLTDESLEKIRKKYSNE